MRAYLAYLSKRLVQFAVVVFVGINITYLVTHMTPINPVEQSFRPRRPTGRPARKPSR